jgi:hypothetical protein
MKVIKVFAVLFGLLMMLTHSGFAETCCEKAAAGGKECRNKCCIAAHKEGKSCSKCNPNKEDLKLKKTEKKSDKETQAKKGR